MNNRITKTLRAKAGFTLVELIVVIAILGILAGVGAVGYSGYIKKADEAADQQLLGFVNQAFAAACIENGVDAKSLDSVPTLNLTGNEGAKKVGAVSLYDKEFQRYLTGNGDAVFKVITALYFDSANGVFRNFGESVYATLSGKFADTDIEALKNSAFATMGMDVLLGKVSFAADLATSVLGDEEDPNSSQFATLILGEENYESLAQYLGVDYLDDDGNVSAEFDEVYGELLTKKANMLIAEGKASDYDDAIVKAKNAVLSNNAVLVAATKFNFDQNDFVTKLGDGTAKQYIKDTMKTDPQLALSQSAMAYAMYTAYAADKNLETDNLDLEEVLSALETTEFKTYMQDATNDTSATAKNVKGYQAAMNMIHASSTDSTAVSNVLLNGFNDPELIALLQQTVS